MPEIVNLTELPSNLLPANSVYIEAGSKWANPFINEPGGLERYKQALAADTEKLRDIDELKDKDLLCYQFSHAEVLMELAAMNQMERERWADQTLGID